MNRRLHTEPTRTLPLEYPENRPARKPYAVYAWVIGICLALSSVLILPADPVSAQVWPLAGGRAVSRNGRWLGPVASATLSSDEQDHLRRGSVHAWDISAPLGSTVYPMGPGQVVYAGCNNTGGYGCWVMVDHKNDYVSMYAHLIDEGNGRVWVERDDIVGAWTPLGRVGWTGMTSFGPHVHWEIRHKTDGRIRVDQLFPRAQMDYCKFCEAGASGGLGAAVSRPIFNSLNSIVSTRFILVLLSILLAAGALARPGMSLRIARYTGVLLLRVARFSGQRIEEIRQSRTWPLAHVILLILVPATLCGSTSAVAVWMMDEGLSAAQAWRFMRYGLSPVFGPGYQAGLRYAAVWGTPCGHVGTLGNSCDVQEVVEAGLAWREEVYQFVGTRPMFAVIPRLNTRFGYRQVRSLIGQTHQAGGLVIVDIGADMKMAKEAIDQLTDYGLDGIAIDIETIEVVTSEELVSLAGYMAQRRQESGRHSEGVLIIWDVFHNVNVNQPFELEGVRIVPIFSGFGSTETKRGGLAVSRKIFGTLPEDSGMMAFDRRWPINRTCRNPNTERGFDCQSWQTLFSDQQIGAVGWWVQQ